MEQLLKVKFEEPSVVKLENSGIRVIKNKTLLAPGTWNGRNYSKEELIKAYHNTDWNDKDTISLIADHRDDDSKGRPLTIRDWVGFVTNHYLTEDGYIKGDLNICDSELAIKLIDGKAPFGISPFIYGKYDKLSNSQKDFIFKNFAIVVEPACKECYVNEYLSYDELNEKLEQVSAFERIRKRMGKSVSEFYAVPRDPPSSSKLPIFDKSHVQNAMARFNQTQFESEEEKSKAKNKIIAAAKKFGINIKDFSKLEENSQSIELKGGQTNMEEKKKLEEVKQTEESNEEEKVEEKVESVVKEAKEEVNESEEESNEESEEKLMEQLATITEKLLNKKKLTPDQAKMQKLESEIDSLKKELKKLQEEKSESEEEKSEDSEKLSAKPRTIAKTLPKEDSFGMFGKSASEGSRELAGILGY